MSRSAPLSDVDGPGAPTSSLATDLIDHVPFGVVVYHLEDPDDPGSLRLVHANNAATKAIGFDVKAEIGRTIAESLPQALETEIPSTYAEVARTGRERDLGEIEYEDDRVERGIFRVSAFPLPDRHVGVIFEEVTERHSTEAARYRALVEASAKIVWVTAPDGMIEDMPQWRAYTGQSVEEVRGFGWLDAIDPGDRADTAEAWAQTVESRGAIPYDVEYRIRGADGVYRWFNARGVPILGEDGEIREWVGVCEEIDERKQAEEALAISESRYRFMSETLEQQIWTALPSGQLDYVNSYTLDFFGRTFEEMIGQGWQGVVHEEDLPLVVERWTHSLATGEPYEVEFRLRCSEDGSWRWHIGRASALRSKDGEVVRWFGANTDIHEKKEAATLMAEANRALEERVAERTRALAAFSEDLKALHRITTTKHTRTEDFFQDYLRAGCVIFELPIGILSQTPLDPDTGKRTYRIHAIESPVPDIAAGLEVPLSEAFCDAVVEHNQTVSYADAADIEELSCHSAYSDRGLRSFIGTPIRVDGDLFGTLNFVSPEPRTEGFAPHEHELIEVMAELVGRLISAQRADRERAQTDAYYRSVVQTVDDGLILVDSTGEILMSNPAARQMLGLGEEETLFGRVADAPRWPIITADGEPFPYEDLPERRVLDTGEPVTGVLQGIVDGDGATRWVSVNARAAGSDAEGNVSAVVISFSDVTEQRRAEEELRSNESQLRKAQEIAHVGGWQWDLKKDRISWSDELYRIFGAEPHAFEPTFENYVRHLHPEERQHVQMVIGGAIERQEAYEIDHRIILQDGTVRHVHGIGEVVLGKNGEPVALQGTAQDVTEAYEAEQNLRHNAAQLEERNAELEQFAYVASHDLQEPLRMVSSFLQLLQRRYEGQLDDTADEYIAYAVDGARRMKVLIQDLLLFSRVGTRGKDFEAVDAERMLATTLNDLAILTEEVGATVEVGPMPTVHADPTQLRQVFQNLIANALKFRGEAAPEVAVLAARTESVRTDGSQAPGWQFSVADNGIGIAPEHVDRVFQIFQRLHSREEYEGTGIGLAMCKKIVERHGGRIWYTSEPGQGTTFHFTLPDNAASQPSRANE